MDDFLEYVDSLKILGMERRYIHSIIDKLQKIRDDFSFSDLVRQAQRSFHGCHPNAIDDPYHVERVVTYKVVYDV